MPPSTSRPPRHGPKLVSALVSVTLGLLAIGLAVPRLYAETATLIGQAAIGEAQRKSRAQAPDAIDQDRIRPDEMRDVAALLDGAARMSGSPMAHSLAGQARLLTADHAVRTGQPAAASVEAAVAGLSAAVAANPADPYVWARLTHAEYRAGRPTAAASAWHMSVLTGPYHPDLMELRLIQGWGLQDWLEPPARAAFEEQVMLYWRLDPGETTLFAHRHGAEALLRRLLSGDPEALDEFNLRYDSIPSASAPSASAGSARP
ncbi:hypothetical protein [Azospirillum soli]|uniref:hypothetical protein n=1 Tax=Azospirillum soli TaxID=1304799 RepID=UPI001AE6CF4D|nr:hypothetical protein [Azospirillum soli]MBP2316397.1 hypothetical protein [Azospirillum soli]